MNWLRRLFGKGEDFSSEKWVGRELTQEELSAHSSVSQIYDWQPKENTTESFIEFFEGDLGKALIRAVPRHPQIVAELLERGAPVDSREAMGSTAVHKCQFSGPTTRECLTLLLNAGADIDIKNNEGETTLYACCQDVNMETAQMFLDMGADHNARDNYGYTPLHIAALNSHIGCHTPVYDCMGYLTMWENPDAAKTCALLLDRGASIDSPDKWGNTPLMKAAGSLNLEVVKLLLSRGANPELVDDDGLSAADHAAEAYESSLTEDADDPDYVIYDKQELADARAAVWHELQMARHPSK